MEYYRRKPLNLIDQMVSLSSENLAETLTDPRKSPVEGLANPIGLGVEPNALMPSPDALVQQAASILAGEMTNSNPAMQAPSSSLPFGFGSAPSSLGPGYSIEGLVRELHDLVETLAKLMAQKPESVVGQTPYITSMGSTGTQPNPSTEANIPVLRSPQPFHPGEMARLSFKIHNDSDHPIQVGFSCTDLTCSGLTHHELNHHELNKMKGDRISSQSITIMPQPLRLEPDARVSMTLTIQIPQDLPLGTYSGQLIAPELSYLRALIILDIA